MIDILNISSVTAFSQIPHDFTNVNIGSGNNLVFSGSKPLREPMLIQFHVAIYSVNG